jgi:hypothetical protein
VQAMLIMAIYGAMNIGTFAFILGTCWRGIRW